MQTWQLPLSIHSSRAAAGRTARAGWPLLMAIVCLSATAVRAGAQQPEMQQIPAASAETCALLDDDSVRSRMDGLLLYLLRACGREDELGGVESFRSFGQNDQSDQSDQSESSGSSDSLVNDRSGESGKSTTQSETSIAENPNTGTLCAGFNDSFELFANNGATGFSRSTDGGVTWDDRGPVGPNTFGDPAMAWSERDQSFYIATLAGGGLELNVSDDDCRTFSVAGTPATNGDDKELIAIDNNPASPFYGRIYIAWIDFGTGGEIALTRSDDGGATWSPQIALSDPGDIVQSAWPIVTPDGDVFVAWTHWFITTEGPFEIEIARSTNGGASFSRVTPPVAGEESPRDASWTGTCGRPALNGGIRYSPFPQIAASADGVLHAVYSYDPDGFNTGDIVNVYYRRSTDDGATWGPEVQLNDDSTNNDQHSPTLAVGAGGSVMTTWYDRRLDPNNFLQDTFRSVSTDGGITWSANERLSDASAPIELDPILTPCYHGDYDTSIITTDGTLVAQWSDDRNTIEGRNDPDVWTQVEAGAGPQFVLSPPVPSEPGVENTWDYTGATGGSTVWLTFGPNAGTTPVPGCPGVSLSIASATPLGNTTSAPDGSGAFVRNVPGGVSGAALFQAVDVASCSVSNRVEATF